VWVAAALLVAFVALLVVQKFLANRLRFVPDEDLMAELAEATLDEDRAGLDSKAWPQWFGPRRDGVTTAPDLLAEWPSGGPPRLWRVEGGDGYSSFAVVGDSAYSMVASGGREAVVCWDVSSGKERWRHPYTPSATFDYGGPRSTPTVVADRLYTVSSAGVLMCLATDDGKVAWERDLVQELGGVAPRWGYATSPLVEDGRVFVAPGGSGGRCLAAFAAADGKLLWAAQDDPAGYSSPIAVTVAGVRQVVFFTGKRVLGVTPEAGKLLWEHPWLTEFQVNAATPLLVRGRSGKKDLAYVFISSGYAKGAALVKVEPSGSGTFRARAVYESNELCCHFASPVRHGDHLYGMDETRDLTCLDLRTGKAVWRERGFKKGTLIRVDDRLLALGEDGKLALIEASPQEYRELARARPFRGKCWTLPALADGRLFLRDQKHVLCLDVRKKLARRASEGPTPNPRWRVGLTRGEGFFKGAP
jgi:outer membrane protein assembly factor BamB